MFIYVDLFDLILNLQNSVVKMLISFGLSFDLSVGVFDLFLVLGSLCLCLLL